MTWQAIKADTPSLEDMLGVFEDEMDDYLDLVKKDFYTTIATWKRKPKFERDVSSSETEVVGEYFTENEVMGWVSHGTRIRYATMTKDFRAKTRPGRIRSGSGSGGVAYVSRRRPRPGIQARKFDELIAEKNKSKLAAGSKRAVNALARMVNAP